MELRDLITETAFIETFWRELHKRRGAGVWITHKQLFEELNDFYEDETGEPRFSSFDAFRKCRDRKVNKKHARRSK